MRTITVSPASAATTACAITIVSPRSFGCFSRCCMGCRVIRWTTAASSGVWSSEDFHPAGCQLPPDRCGGAKACILPGLAKHLVLNAFRGAELAQDLDEETFFVGGEEVQAGSSV